MKKKILPVLLGLTVLIAGILVAVFLFKSSNDNYLNAIPADAKLVTGIDVANLFDKSGIDDMNLTDKLKNALGGSVSEEELNDATDYLDSPQKIGIDFRSKVYLFSTPDNSFCLVAKVADKDKVNEFMTKMAKNGVSEKPTEKDGIYWTKLFGELPTAFNSQTLLVMMPTDGFYNPNDAITKMLQQDKKDSYISTDQGEKLIKTEGDITMSTSLSALPQNILGAYAQIIPQEVRLSEVDVNASLEFLNGKLVLKSGLSTQNKKLKALLEQINANTKKIKGLYVKKSQENVVFWSSAGVNGEWLLEEMKKNDDLKQILFMVERAIDIEKMIKSIDGDLMASIPDINSSTFDIPYIVAAQTKNQDFLNDVDYWISSMRESGLSMTPSGDNMYKLTADDQTFYWGTRPDELYITSTPSLVQSTLSGTGASKLKDMEDEICDSRLFVYINLQQLANASQETAGIPYYFTLAQAFEGITFKLTEAENMEVAVQMTNKDVNVLKFIIDNLVDSFLQ